MRESYFFHTENLTVGYDGKPLIREIEIRVRQGEILTLIGPNGAGKSTVMGMIARLIAKRIQYIIAMVIPNATADIIVVIPSGSIKPMAPTRKLAATILPQPNSTRIKVPINSDMYAFIVPPFSFLNSIYIIIYSFPKDRCTQYALYLENYQMVLNI